MKEWIGRDVIRHTSKRMQHRRWLIQLQSHDSLSPFHCYSLRQLLVCILVTHASQFNRGNVSDTKMSHVSLFNFSHEAFPPPCFVRLRSTSICLRHKCGKGSFIVSHMLWDGHMHEACLTVSVPLASGMVHLLRLTYSMKRSYHRYGYSV